MTNSMKDGTERVQAPRTASPTLLTQTEAEELDTLIKTVVDTRWNLGHTMASHTTKSEEYAEALAASDQAYGALYRWQLRHGLVTRAESGLAEVTS